MIQKVLIESDGAQFKHRAAKSYQNLLIILRAGEVL